MSTKVGTREQVIGAVLVGLGALFLFAQLFDFNLGRIGWPFFVIIPGVLLLAGAVVGGKSAAGLAVPGSIVTTIGVILLVQSVTGQFQTWAYVWALIPTSVGVGMYLNGTLAESGRLRSEGAQTAGIGLLLFVIFGAFFELFIFGGLAGTGLGSVLFPILLIAGGAYLLLRQRQRTRPVAFGEAPDDNERQPSG